jgi:hypothetical protein
MVLMRLQNFVSFTWYLGIFVLIYFGWTLSDRRYVVPAEGTGYWLGIIGGSMMLMLLLYPVRKRKPRWKYTGSVKFWFRFHMFLGVAGPTLVIFHSGFQLGSLNGSIAFFSMIIVALSGLVGRYLYRRIHHGLYGEKIKFEEIYSKDERWEVRFDELKQHHPNVIEELTEVEKQLVNRHTGINRSLWFYQSVQWKLLSLKRRIRREIGKNDDGQQLLARIKFLKSIAKLGINEILFSYWHILHFPLFIMLVISGITHVVVVHFY